MFCVSVKLRLLLFHALGVRYVEHLSVNSSLNHLEGRTQMRLNLINGFFFVFFLNLFYLLVIQTHGISQ